MPRVVNRLGRRYGMLLVTEYVGSHTEPNGHKRSVWKCSCDCGEERTVFGYALTSGSIASCTACSKNSQKKEENMKVSAEDYIGKTYGMFTIVGINNRRNTNFFECKCNECGKVKFLTASQLKTDRINTCRCKLNSIMNERIRAMNEAKPGPSPEKNEKVDKIISAMVTRPAGTSIHEVTRALTEQFDDMSFNAIKSTYYGALKKNPEHVEGLIKKLRDEGKTITDSLYSRGPVVSAVVSEQPPKVEDVSSDDQLLNSVAELIEAISQTDDDILYLIKGFVKMAKKAVSPDIIKERDSLKNEVESYRKAALRSSYALRSISDALNEYENMSVASKLKNVNPFILKVKRALHDTGELVE